MSKIIIRQVWGTVKGLFFFKKDKVMMLIQIANEHVLKILFNSSLVKELIRSYKQFKEDAKDNL